jgi:NAD(P)-dependent dehydrogenase (short-subunit alcohol dehydrogenase family)
LGDIEFTLKSGFSAHVTYSASKAAVNMVNAKYANEFREAGFLFLAISPGYVDTSIKKRKFSLRYLSALFPVFNTADCSPTHQLLKKKWFTSLPWALNSSRALLTGVAS